MAHEHKILIEVHGEKLHKHTPGTQKIHNFYAFGYYWWGEKELITQLRSQSNLAVSRLAALGRPGVTEGDVKSAMAVKIMDLLGAGGMFVEFFSMNFDEDFMLMGHDGPSNIN
ncbi:unnamed protein product, partial [marine sediment metagenome]